MVTGTFPLKKKFFDAITMEADAPRAMSPFLMIGSERACWPSIVQHMQRGGCITRPLQFIRELMEILHHCHSNGIVLRRLSESSLLIDPMTGHILLTDVKAAQTFQWKKLPGRQAEERDATAELWKTLKQAEGDKEARKSKKEMSSAARARSKEIGKRGKVARQKMERIVDRLRTTIQKHDLYHTSPEELLGTRIVSPHADVWTAGSLIAAVLIGGPFIRPQRKSSPSPESSKTSNAHADQFREICRMSGDIKKTP